MCSGPGRIATACCSRCARQAAFRLYSKADEWRIRRMQAYLADLSVPAVLRDVVLPYLAELGER
jgi:hypothetical protein